MLWLHTWLIGIKSVLLHPMRSLLTVLGIFIGVASVIWLLAIGAGISEKAQEQIEGLGADNIIVRSVKPAKAPDGSTSFILPYGLLRADYDILVETIPTIRGNSMEIDGSAFAIRCNSIRAIRDDSIRAIRFARLIA